MIVQIQSHKKLIKMIHASTKQQYIITACKTEHCKQPFSPTVRLFQSRHGAKWIWRNPSIEFTWILATALGLENSKAISIKKQQAQVGYFPTLWSFRGLRMSTSVKWPRDRVWSPRRTRGTDTTTTQQHNNYSCPSSFQLLYRKLVHKHNAHTTTHTPQEERLNIYIYIYMRS